MSSKAYLALVGDFRPTVRAHRAIPRVLAVLAGALECELVPVWLHTTTLSDRADKTLAPYHGIWCVPGSPYVAMNGALNAIAYARQSGCPFLGTCGGFQHAVLEYARNVLGHTEADHAESNPAATMPLIAPLACTLVGTRGEILLQQDSKIADIYGTLETTEEYHCSYGLNPAFQRLLASGALKISGADESKSARVIEHSAHPFFMATLFQPELKGPDENPHPVIKAFVQAALARSNLK